MENAEDMGLARATAVAIAEADADKAADFVSLLADFLTEIDAESNGEKVADGFIAAQLLGHLGPLAAAAIPALEHCLALDGRDHDLIRWLRLLAAEAEWQITGDPAVALAVAMEMLGDQEWWLVGHAADLLASSARRENPLLPIFNASWATSRTTPAAMFGRLWSGSCRSS